MSNVFTDQTYLQIVLTSGVDITDATVTQIQYRSPSGARGAFEAEVMSAASGVLRYIVPAGTSPFTEKGEWRFWNHIVFSDGRVARGDTYVKSFLNDEQ